MSTANDKPKKVRRRKDKRKGKKVDKRKGKKVDASKAEPKPEPKPEPKVNYLGASMIRPEILDEFGRRVARIIGDAIKEQNIVASVAWYRVSTPELARMHEAGIITGGFDDKGRRDSSPIICNI
jgi:hypothetical protein